MEKVKQLSFKESKKLQMVLARKEKEWIDLSLKEERRFK